MAQEASAPNFSEEDIDNIVGQIGPSENSETLETSKRLIIVPERFNKSTAEAIQRHPSPETSIIAQRAQECTKVVSNIVNNIPSESFPLPNESFQQTAVEEPEEIEDATIVEDEPTAQEVVEVADEAIEMEEPTNQIIKTTEVPQPIESIELQLTPEQVVEKALAFQAKAKAQYNAGLINIRNDVKLSENDKSALDVYARSLISLGDSELSKISLMPKEWMSTPYLTDEVAPQIQALTMQKHAADNKFNEMVAGHEDLLIERAS